MKSGLPARGRPPACHRRGRSPLNQPTRDHADGATLGRWDARASQRPRRPGTRDASGAVTVIVPLLVSTTRHRRGSLIAVCRECPSIHCSVSAFDVPRHFATEQEIERHVRSRRFPHAVEANAPARAMTRASESCHPEPPRVSRTESKSPPKFRATMRKAARIRPGGELRLGRRTSSLRVTWNSTRHEV